jgi:hypothetical protein
MRETLCRLGFLLCAGTIVICAVLHCATFLTIIPPVWILPAFPLFMGVVLCAKALESGRRIAIPRTSLGFVCCALLVYAVFTFVYFYRTTGGTSSVGIVDGQYVAGSKGHVIRIITEYEYRMFPNLWIRVMSAWIGAAAVSAIVTFTWATKSG